MFAPAANEPVRVLSVPDNGIQPEVVLADNRLHLAYFSGDPKHGDVFYIRSDDFECRSRRHRHGFSDESGITCARGLYRTMKGQLPMAGEYIAGNED
jgi:hypothetical protein